MHSNGKKIFPQAATILAKYDLSTAFTLLLILESAYNGNAVSDEGTVGYWQIIDVGATEYGLKYIGHLIEAEKKKLQKQCSKSNESCAKQKQIYRMVEKTLLPPHTAAR